MKNFKEENLLKASYDYEDYDKNVVVLTEDDLIDLNLINLYQSNKKGCCKTSKGSCCKNKTSKIEIIK